MAGHIHLCVPLIDDHSLDRQTVRSALDTIEADDLSQKSPVSVGVPEAGIEIGDDEVTVRIEGHSGDFSKTSEQALTSALAGLHDAAGEPEVVDGGYDTTTDSGDEDDGDAGEDDQDQDQDQEQEQEQEQESEPESDPAEELFQDDE